MDVLVGKILDQSLMEVEQEVELKALAGRKVSVDVGCCNHHACCHHHHHLSPPPPPVVVHWAPQFLKDLVGFLCFPCWGDSSRT